MARVIDGVSRALGEVEAALDWLRQRKRRGPYRIVPYRGHGIETCLYLMGRVLRGEAIPPASARDSAFKNLLNTLRRLESDEVPAARVRARVGGSTWEAVTNDEGYFRFEMETPTAGAEGREVWRNVELELVDPLDEGGAPARATGHVLVTPSQARFGIVSDIDDTVVKTDVTNVLRMLRLVFLTNAHTRLPFEGVAAFYRALHRGEAGDVTNPIFYVSSSPWNLYDLLNEVFEVHGVPMGPLFLKDYRLSPKVVRSQGHHDHKLEAIEEIVCTHPQLPFVLLGDSGQQDPEIYREVVRRYPGRIRAIYIREVGEGNARDREVRALAAEVAREGVEMMLVGDTVTAARHAADLGLIDPASLSEIAGEKARDEAAPGPLESAVTGNRAR